MLKMAWRVENRYGEGPYRSRADICNLLDCISKESSIFHKNDRTPTPYDDKKLSDTFNLMGQSITDEWFCGFKTIQDYQNWFMHRSVRDLLHHTGFFLSQYALEDSDIVIGDRQAMLKIGNKFPTAFRFCNTSGIMDLDTAKKHPPIGKFLKLYLSKSPS